MTQVTFVISDTKKWLLQVKLEGLTRIDLWQCVKGQNRDDNLVPS